MVSKALFVQHPRASDSQGITPKYPAAVRMQEEHGGFPSRFVSINIPAFDDIPSDACASVCMTYACKPGNICFKHRPVLRAISIFSVAVYQQ